LESFPLDTAPDWGLQDSVEADVETQQLGDGYVLRRPKGINYLRETWDPSWSHLSQIEAEDTYAWLKARLHMAPFLWTHPTSNMEYKVVCTSAGKVASDVGLFAVRATFVQDFNI
jgi:phage-related protein